VKLLIRTWNVFHGRTVPETRQTHLERMIRLAVEGRPDVVCLQEVPVWALPELEAWSGMAAAGAVAMRSVGGQLGRRLTDLDPMRLRSALTGQANAVLVARRLAVSGKPEVLVLNPRSFRRREAARQGLPASMWARWARNRRVAQVLRVTADAESAVFVNLHLTSLPDSRPADAELLRAATYAEGFAAPSEPLVLAGDLNLSLASSATLRELGRWGFSPPGAGIDHILARGFSLVRGPEAWPSERRRLGALLLSDHAPVEAEMIGQ
jgi:endonuclease/exonuclease/phosphatase family metal-dependent hydrolase